MSLHQEGQRCSHGNVILWLPSLRSKIKVLSRLCLSPVCQIYSSGGETESQGRWDAEMKVRQSLLGNTNRENAQKM